MMKAMVATGRPGDMVAFGEVGEPDPRPGEVVVAVEAFSVNRGETFLLEAPRDGWRPGKDVAGRVVQETADGSGPRVGDRIVGHPPSGGWAQRVAVAVDAVAVLPDSVSVVTAAALPLAGITALRLLRAVGPLPGQRLLLTGASGGVGHYLVELATAGGAQVTAVVGSAERGARLAQFGARIVTSLDAAGGGFDTALESVGGASLPAVLARVRPGGQLVWFGQASRQPVTLDFFRIVTQTPSVRLRLFDYSDGPAVGPDLATLVRLVAGGCLHPEIGVVRDWSHTGEVLADLTERRVRGNAVLTIPTLNSQQESAT